MNRRALLNLTALVAVPLIVTHTSCILNNWLLASHKRLTPTDAAFLEGIGFVLLGAMVLLGSGGITHTSLRAAVLASAAGAVFDRDTISPSEIFKRDAWKPKGHVLLGLILLLTGVSLLMVYFGSLRLA